MRNTELLEKTMQFILDNPEKHDQRVWVNECGTAACFAGWAHLLSGGRFDHLCELSPHAGWFKTVENGMKRKVRDMAAEKLGLTEKEADILFAANNTIPMLQMMVKDIVNGDEIRETEDYETED